MTHKELCTAIGNELFPDWKMIRESDGLLFSKRLHDRTKDVILISTPTTVNGYRLGSWISGRRALLDVEDILAHFYKKYCPDTPLLTIVKDVFVGKVIPSTPIESAEDLAPIYAPMREVVFDQILPFLERFNTLEAVYEHAMEMHRIRDTDEFALSRFIHSPVEYRLSILKRLIAAPDFIEYGERFAEAYKDNPHWDSKGFYIELFEYLKKM